MNDSLEFHWFCALDTYVDINAYHIVPECELGIPEKI